MPGTNLTRDEARERARLLSVDGYDVHLDLTTATDQQARTYSSTTVLRFTSAESGASTFVDLIAPTVREVTLNGRSLDPAEVYDGSRITLTDLAAENELRVVADTAYMNTGEGLHRFFDPVDGEAYLYTQFEVPDARRMYATFEQPDLKGTFALTVTAPSSWRVVSNSPTPEPEAAGEGVAVWRFAATPRISTYITALVAGPYHVVRDTYAGTHAEIPMDVYCRASLAEHLDAEEIFDVTKRGFAFFEELFDYPYPFAKYDQLFVPEYNMGAMENAGCVTIRDEYLYRSRTTDASYEARAVTILHELAHMWFGDLVTMRWWDDLWLNESFATYASVLCQAEATRWTHGWTTFANTDKTWAYRQDQLPSTHPISADIRDLEDVEVNFDGITYAKGASVLKQLVAWVGREEFFAGLRHYFKAYEWRNASLADLREALEETSGRDLDAWSREWLETAGVNTLRPEFDEDAEGRFGSFAVLQSAIAEQPTLRSHRVAVGLYDRTDEGLVRRDRVELDVVGERTEVPQLVGARRPDLILLNDDDLTYAKIRLDDRSLSTLVDHIGDLTDSLPRSLCWTAAWDMTRDAELAARDYLALVLSGVGKEPDINVVQLLLRTAATAVEMYTAPDRREEARRAFAAGVLALAQDAEPSSDHQLALVRSFASAAIDEHAGYLGDLLEGAVVLDGLAIDAELRWLLVQNLARLGAIGDERINAELERDATIKGQEAAAHARASLPTAEAKARAWEIAVDRDDVPNQTQFRTIRGFWQPAQEELLAEYVDRYLDAAGWVWDRKANEMAQYVLIGLFPRQLATQDTVDRVRAWLEQKQPVPAVRRLVEEGVADIERGLRAQERDAQA
ncbi:aminopeptidase N [Actinopolymorpha rutila]|uniref:Aminopeptidase N n=1 Tax=Actinopolymorpha rutila TaxID=446787 RepID=A0A852ZGL6_9ACTN|nr:aminopeptidase N [Actinopolymorpha rutila]NYH91038.1 aminopeptidase N [Actinopolymorpha rutila]